MPGGEKDSREGVGGYELWTSSPLEAQEEMEQGEKTGCASFYFHLRRPWQPEQGNVKSSATI